MAQTHSGRNVFTFGDRWQRQREHEDRIDLAQQEMDFKNTGLAFELWDHLDTDRKRQMADQGYYFDSFLDDHMSTVGGNVHDNPDAFNFDWLERLKSIR